MDDVLAASGKADLVGCKAALRRHLRSSLAPALVAEVAALIEAEGGGDATGSLACIQYFLECGACLDARKEEGGKTALMIAAEAGRADAVGVMLEHWARVDTEGDGEGGGGPDVINAVGGEYEEAALSVAADNGHVEVVAALLGATGKDGVAADLNITTKHGATAILCAASNGHVKVVAALLGATGKDGVAADLNITNKDGSTALILAAQFGHPTIVTALLDAKERHAHITAAVDVSMKDNSGHTAHHYASTRHPAEFTPETLARLLPPIPPCPKHEATAFLQSLDVNNVYLNPKFDRCYCERCYKGPATISNEGPTSYVVPEPGWVRFGLHVERRALALDVFNKWCACFHGVKSALVLNSILDCGGLMKPGSMLIDSTKLESTKCAGRQDEVVYTSPTIKYAGLKFYAEPCRFATAAGVEMRGSIVVQCRQNPATFEKQGETMAFKRKMPGHLEKNCPNVDLAEIEWKTEADRAVIPYGLLVRVWQKGKDPEAKAYSSPVDGTGKWWGADERQIGQGGGGGGGGAADVAAAIPVVR